MKMKINRLFLVGFTIFAAVVLFPLAASTGQESKNGDGKKKEIPLNSVYFTDQQAGLKWLTLGEADKDLQKVMLEVFRAISKLGASTVFLASGDNIREAFGSSWEALCHGAGTENLVKTENLKSNEAWLVVFFGIQGGKGTWQITSVEIKDKQIRMSYKKPKRGAIVATMSGEMALAPLGKLEPGAYSVELFDADEQQAVLTRRVVVPKN
jgi:hypothetical protein